MAIGYGGCTMRPGGGSCGSQHGMAIGYGGCAVRPGGGAKAVPTTGAVIIDDMDEAVPTTPTGLR